MKAPPIDDCIPEVVRKTTPGMAEFGKLPFTTENTVEFSETLSEDDVNDDIDNQLELVLAVHVTFAFVPVENRTSKVCDEDPNE